MIRPFTFLLIPFSLGTLHAQWVQVGDSANSNINVMEVYNNELFFGGNMTQFNGMTTYNTMRYNGATFSMHTTLIGGTGFSCLEEYDGDLYGGGGMAQSGLSGTVRWNGSTWQAGPVNTNNTVNVNAMLAWNNLLIIGGSFTVPTNYIVQFNGTTAQPMGAGFNSGVTALASYNGELYASGSMTMSGSTNLNRIAKWNGTAWVDVGGGFDNSCTELVSHDGYLYASGSFTTAGGASALRIARWNGSNWAPVGGGVTVALGGGISTLESTAAGLLVGGKGISAGTVTNANALLFNGTTWSELPGIPSNEVVLDFQEYQGQLYTVGYRGGIGPAGHIYRNGTVGFSEIDPFPALALFPNPTEARLNLSGLPAIQGRFEVLDAVGRICASGSLDNSLDVSALVPGNYQLRILSDKGNTVRRFVRSH
ncbi:MAG: T9SS type A sorting domain-containing protein [Flavobacteriales bacterium]|nr:T9SS type A sorting domain-containing protein [Flavobacteriales bacterium]MCB0793597.1 T9SS type A sorting domain-containing protein [Flavobacteriales bacterium]